jgi:hypothetical protein
MCPLTRQLTGTQFSRAGADEKAAYAGRVRFISSHSALTATIDLVAGQFAAAAITDRVVAAAE